MSAPQAVETYGDFIELTEERAGESLTLRFSPGSTPLQQRWRNNGLSADFLAEYVKTFLPADDESAARRADIAAAISYVANELLENAMKYSAEGAGKTISMRLHLEKDRVLFHQSNIASAARAAALRDFIARLESMGAEALLLRQMENGGDDAGSGLGLLTMINDYGARPAFRIAADGAATGEALVVTQVELSI